MNRGLHLTIIGKMGCSFSIEALAFLGEKRKGDWNGGGLEVLVDRTGMSGVWQLL